MDIAGQEMNRQNRAYLSDFNKAIINEVTKPRYTDVVDISKNRKEEKERISQENSFSKKLGLDFEQDVESLKIELVDMKEEQKVIIESILDGKKNFVENETDNESPLFQEMLDIMLEDD